MNLNRQLSALLLFYEKERQMARAENLEKRIIPQQQKIVDYNRKYNLPDGADQRILEGLKREYKHITGKNYLG